MPDVGTLLLVLNIAIIFAIPIFGDNPNERPRAS